jgi:hypothetical protein
MLKGFEIAATDGHAGTVSDFLFDDISFKVRWMVVDTGTWLPGRKVLIHPSAIGGADLFRRSLTVAATKAKIEAGPDIARDRPVSRQMEGSTYDYYGWDPLWGSSFFSGDMMGAAVMPPFNRAATHLPGEGRHGPRPPDQDPHLRSTAEVSGYHIEATDGAIGHLENVLIDDMAWDIRYLVVDTRNWWFGQHVLISPFAVRAFDWGDSKVRLNVTREQIKASPPWAPLDMIDRAYEQRLHTYYGWPGYGW